MNALRVYQRLWPYLKPYRLRFLIGFVLGLVYAGSGVAVVKLIKDTLPRVLADTTQGVSFSDVAKYAMLLPAVFLVRGVCDFLNQYCISWVGLRAVMDLRNRMFAHI